MSSSAGSRARVEHYCEQIEQMAGTDARFGLVEDAINNSDLGPEEKTALWMLAWSLIGPEAQAERAGSNVRASIRRRRALQRRRLLALRGELDSGRRGEATALRAVGGPND